MHIADEAMMIKKLTILFLCTGNSCRSQMAEGWARHLKGDVLGVYSAGIEMHGLNHNAVKVMAEVGVDISHHRSKHVSEVLHIPFDYVITVCGHAQENCPVFPPKLAANAKTEEEALGHYRRVRDEIRTYIETLPEVLLNANPFAVHL
jgi:arsenate reductase